MDGKVKNIILAMCDLWLKTHGLQGKEHVDIILRWLDENKNGTEVLLRQKEENNK